MTLQSMGRGARADDEIGRKIVSLAPWFHNIHLPSGHETAPDHPLGDFPFFKWKQLAPYIPNDLSEMRVLDIGCNAGFYTFELAARGASVLGIDVSDHYLEQARWVREVLDPPGEVEFERMHVYDLGNLAERFDIVLFLGVLYHLRYPLLALDLVAQKVGQTLVLQTLTMGDEEETDVPDDLLFEERERLSERGWPKMAFIERSFAGDETNWWAPDHACVEAMVRSAGMRIVERPGHEIYMCEPDGDASGAVSDLEAVVERPDPKEVHPS